MFVENAVNRVIQTLVRKNIHPNEEEASYWNRHWERQIEDFYKHGSPLETRNDWWRNLYDEMADHYELALGSVVGKTICELGAGSGYASLLLAKRGANVTLLDFSETSQQYAEKLIDYFSLPESRVQFVRGNLFQSPIQNNAYDIVWNCGVIEHYEWTQAVELVRQMKRHAKPGGRVMVTLPNLLSPELIYQMLRVGKGSEIYFSHRKLKRLMEEAGLSEVKVFPINYWVPSFLPHKWANTMRSRAIGTRWKSLGWLFTGIGTV